MKTTDVKLALHAASAMFYYAQYVTAGAYLFVFAQNVREHVRAIFDTNTNHLLVEIDNEFQKQQQ